jgi:hypothetical protein
MSSKYFVKHHSIKFARKIFRSGLLLCALGLQPALAGSAGEKTILPANFLETISNQNWGDPNMDRQEVIEHTFIPYKGPSHPGVDTSTLTGKVMCG